MLLLLAVFDLGVVLLPVLRLLANNPRAAFRARSASDAFVGASFLLEDRYGATSLAALLGRLDPALELPLEQLQGTARGRIKAMRSRGLER